MRKMISNVKYEKDMIQSDGALERHWKCSCWVALANSGIAGPVNSEVSVAEGLHLLAYI